MQKSILWLCAVPVVSLMAQNFNEAQILEKLQNKKEKSFDQKSFTPDISLILDASMVSRNIADSETGHLEIPGLTHSHAGHDHAGHSHAPMHEKKGFNLNYAELSMYSAVDPYFDLAGVFHIGESSFEIEEAYVTTRDLPYHLKVKIGKFKSAFGYLNDKHHHTYSFADIPMIYDALLGSHGLNEKGVQLQYVLPTSLYLMAGVELLRGENEQSFGESAFADIEAADQPNLIVGYLKTSFDAGEGGTLLAGVSLAGGESRIDHLEDEEGAHAFSGDTKIYGVDLTYKKYFASDRVVSFQNEYLLRDMDGTKYIPDTQNGGWAKEIGLQKKQGGFYSALIYQHDKNWRAGVRYSAVTQNDVTANSVDQNKPDDMDVTSLMLEYNPSEFSRIRLQYNNNQAKYNEMDEKEDIHEVILQFNYAIGAHGAHPF